MKTTNTTHTPAKVLAICNNKGGCCKTATAQNLGAALRLDGYKVLLIDLDSQANLTACFGATLPQGVNISHAMQNGKGAPSLLHLRAAEGVAGVLDLVPASEDLAAFNVAAAQAPDRTARLAAIVSQFLGQYDFILIDTPPALDLLTINALYCADAVITPILPEPLAVSGLAKVRSAAQTIAGHKGREIPQFVVLQQFDRRNTLHKLTADTVEGAGFHVAGVRVRKAVAFPEATATGCDIFEYSPKSKGAEDYKAFAAEVVEWVRTF